MTGACALALELVWSRLGALVVGAGTPGFAIVLSATMLGLALGAEIGGRLGCRRPDFTTFRRLQWTAAAAAAVATIIIGRLASLELAGSWSLPALGFSLFAVVALAMTPIGATLPALCASLHANEIAGLYAANVAGAVAGTLATGYAAVPILGLRGVALTAAAASAIAPAFLGRDRRHAVPPPKKAATTLDFRLTIAAALSGFFGLSFEVLSTRYLVNGIWTTTHGLAVILASFLAGLSIAAAFVARSQPRAEPKTLGWVLIGSAAFCLVAAPWLASASIVATFGRSLTLGYASRLTIEALTAFLLLAPCAAALGVVFPMAAARAAARGGPAAFGRISAINTLAGAAGGLASAYVLLPAFGLRGALLVAAAPVLLYGAWLSGRIAVSAACVVLLASLLWAGPTSTGAHPGQGTLVPPYALGREKQFRVLCYHEGPLATTQVLERGDGIKDLIIDGYVAAGTERGATYMPQMGSLPLALHLQPRSALVICFGTGTTARAVAANPDVAIDIAEIDPNVLACADSFGGENDVVLKRATVHVEDGRRFLAATDRRFDIITQEPMPPYFAGMSSLYSLEYYQLARRRLSDDGILVQWLPLHLTTPEDARQIAATALAVFPETRLALSSDGTGILVSAMQPLGLQRIADAAESLGVRFVLDPAGVARFTAGAEPVTDDRPTLEYSGTDRLREISGRGTAPHLYNLKLIEDAAHPNSSKTD